MRGVAMIMSSSAGSAMKLAQVADLCRPTSAALSAT